MAQHYKINIIVHIIGPRTKTFVTDRFANGLFAAD